MATFQSSIVESELPELQQKAVDLLDMLQEYLPDKTGKVEFQEGSQHSAQGP